MLKLSGCFFRSNHIASTLRTLALGVLGVIAVATTSTEARAAECDVIKNSVTLDLPAGGGFVAGRSLRLTVKGDLSFYGGADACSDVSLKRIFIYDSTSDSEIGTYNLPTFSAPTNFDPTSGLSPWKVECTVEWSDPANSHLQAFIAFDKGGEPFKAPASIPIDVAEAPPPPPLAVTQSPAAGLVVGASKTVTVTGGLPGDFSLTAGSGCSITQSNNVTGVYTVRADAPGTCSLTASRAGDEATKAVSFAMVASEQVCTMQVNRLNIDVDWLYDFYGQNPPPIRPQVWGEATFTRVPNIAGACERSFFFANLVNVDSLAKYGCNIQGPKDASFAGSNTLTLDVRDPNCLFAITPTAALTTFYAENGQVSSGRAGLAAWLVPPPVKIALGKTTLVKGERTSFTYTGGGRTAVRTMSTDPACAIENATESGGDLVARDGTGSCRVTVSFGRDLGDEEYAPHSGVSGMSGAVTLKTAQEPLSIDNKGVTSIKVNDTVVFTVLGGSGTGRYDLTAAPSDVCSVTGSTDMAGSFSVAGEKKGRCTLTATREGEGDILAAEPVTFSFDVNAIEQQALNALPGEGPFIAGGTKTVSLSGGTVGAYTLVSGTPLVCSIEATEDPVIFTVKGLKGGTCSVTASRSDDGDVYLPVTKSLSLEVGRTPQTIALIGQPTSGATGGKIALAASEGATPVTFTSTTPSICAFGDPGAPGTVSLLTGGTCSIKASRAGNDLYEPAELTFSFPVLISQPITVSVERTLLSFNEEVRYTVDGAQSGTLRVWVDGPCAVRNLNGLSFVRATASSGTCTVRAKITGGTGFADAEASSATITLRKPLQMEIGFKAAGYELTFGQESNLGPELRQISDLAPVTGAVLTVTPGSGCAITNGVLKAVSGTGSCKVTATKTMDGFEDAVAETTVTLKKAKQPPLSFGTEGLTVRLGQTIDLPARTTGGLPYGGWTFRSSDADLCQIDGTSLVVKASSGSCVISAERGGDDNYETATASATFLLAPSNPDAPSLNFTGPYYVTDTVDLSKVTEPGAIGPANPKWSYTAAGACEVRSNDVLHLLSAGTCTVTVDQAASGGFTAISASASLTVLKRPQSISWTQTLSGTYGDKPIKLDASADSKLAVTYTASGPSGCSIENGDDLVLAGAGDCAVTASQAGNDEWAAATAVEKSFTIAAAPLTGFGFTADGYEVTYLTGLDLNSVIEPGPGNGTISFTADNQCSIGAGNVLSVPKGVGTCTVTANKTAGNNHLAGSDTALITFRRAASGAITLSRLPAQNFVGEELDVPAYADRPGNVPSTPLTVAVTADPAGACKTTDSRNVALAAAGTCNLTVTALEDDYFTTATGSAQIAIGQRAQEIVWEQNLPDATYGDGPIELTATAGSGLDVTYTTSDASVCDLVTNSRNMLELKRSGTCSVTARQGGNDEWAEAPPATRSFEVLLQPQQDFRFTQKGYMLAKGRTLDLRSEITGVQGDGEVSFFLEGGKPPKQGVSATSGDVAPCSLSGDTLTANTGTGSCTVRAVLAADPNGKYGEAEASTTVALETIDQSAKLVVAASGVLKYPGSVTLSATGGEGTGALSFNLLDGPCSLDADVLTSTGKGTCRVTATRGADADYNAATSEPRSVVVGESLAAKASVSIVRQNLLNTARNMLDFNRTANRLNQHRSGGGGGGYGALAPEGTSAQGSVAFSTSMQQMVQAAGKGDMQVVPTAATRPDAPYTPAERQPGALDIWLDGRYAWSNGADSEGGLDQRVFLGELGIDYLISGNLLVGVSARIDTNNANIGGEGGSLDTLGWMAGPYAVYEIAPGLQVDAKLNYGQSGNDLSVKAAGEKFDGSYDTTRWLAEAGVRGSYTLSELLIEPGLRASYYRETADAFRLDNAGGKVEEVELSLIRLAFDPRITWTHVTGEGTSLGPFLSPQLVAEWQDLTDEDTTWDVYGVVEGGLSIATEDYSLSGSIKASGIGGDGDMIYSAGADLTIPLN